MTAWSREDTQNWYSQIELRVEDINYHLAQTIKWCEDYGVYDDETVFACSVVTVLWVSFMRGESISRREMFELLAIEYWEDIEDAEYTLDPSYLNLDYPAILPEVLRRLQSS